jgi:uncharacterized protein YbjT (DUF2867 family)
MRILVIGASQGTGALAVEAALARGHEVTAFARSPEKLALENPRLARARGDFHDKASVEGVVPGHDAVIITASSTSLKGFKRKPNYFSLGTGYVIGAMRTSGVKRLVVLSALGTGESRRLMNFFVDKLVVGFLLKLPFADHERQERLVRDSGLDWVIARPSRLTDGPARKKYVARTAIEPVPASISRADVADFLVRAAEEDTWLRQAVQLGG